MRVGTYLGDSDILKTILPERNVLSALASQGEDVTADHADRKSRALTRSNVKYSLAVLERRRTRDTTSAPSTQQEQHLLSDGCMDVSSGPCVRETVCGLYNFWQMFFGTGIQSFQSHDSHLLLLRASTEEYSGTI